MSSDDVALRIELAASVLAWVKAGVKLFSFRNPAASMSHLFHGSAPTRSQGRRPRSHHPDGGAPFLAGAPGAAAFSYGVLLELQANRFAEWLAGQRHQPAGPKPGATWWGACRGGSALWRLTLPPMVLRACRASSEYLPTFRTNLLSYALRPGNCTGLVIAVVRPLAPAGRSLGQPLRRGHVAAIWQPAKATPTLLITATDMSGQGRF